MLWQRVQERWRNLRQIGEVVWEYRLAFWSYGRSLQNCEWILTCHRTLDRCTRWAWLRFLWPNPSRCMCPWRCIVDLTLLVDLWQDHSIHSELFNIVHILSDVIDRRHFWHWDPRFDSFKHNLRSIILAQIGDDIVAILKVCPDLLDSFHLSLDLACWTQGLCLNSLPQAYCPFILKCLGLSNATKHDFDYHQEVLMHVE